MQKLLAEIAKGGRIAISDLPEGMAAKFLAEIALSAKTGVLHVARDGLRMAGLAEALRFFAPGLEVIQLPSWDCMPYDRLSPNGEVAGRRIAALSRLVAEPVKAGRVLLAPLNATLQRLPPRAHLAAAHFSARVGAKVDAEALGAFLARQGYNRVGTVMEPGDYAFRGGLIDIFPPGGDEGFRLDLFGDRLESIRRFDPLTQRATGRAETLDLLPVSEVPLDAEGIARFRAGYRHAFGAVTGEDPLYAAISEGRKHVGMEHWLPLFYDRLETVFDYLPGAVVTLDEALPAARDARLAEIADHYDVREKAYAAGTGLYKPLRPERLYLHAEGWDAALEGRAVLQFTAHHLPADRGAAVSANGRAGRDFAPERALPDVNVFEAVAHHLAALRGMSRRAVIASFSAGARERLAGLLRDHGVEDIGLVASFADVLSLPRSSVALAVLGLEHGFESDDLAVISEQDILGDRLVRPRRQRRRAADLIAEASTLSPGDLVVHMDHGIGRYDGLRTVEISGAAHDCLLIVYDGGDRLYLPVENIEMLSRYGSDAADVALDRLGGAGWQARKARLKRRLKDMAEELIRIAALRHHHASAALSVPEGLYEEFCARFPFEETEDQARAITETLADLARGQPMDRLVCGDVGFGKTEVALRAAFVAAMSGKQVAVVCPTTLLARQHAATFAERFRGYPIKIGQLSRLVRAKEAKTVKADLAAGRIDIIVGTHALLSKSVAFGDLALVIVDEEQRFGVKHKERLKQLRADVHVLTLTATPIPRTLQLALSGVRDLSLIATPPVDRLAVHTFVLPFDPVVAREAILRERYRGGQSFYVCPRIEDLDEVGAFLKEQVPEVKFEVAHGRLAPGELDDVMTAFYEGAYDILLSTDIVESGLDIPNANTLLVHRADLFGLAQLSQLRGGIGRSKRRAYAYFTFSAAKPITAGAEKRLHVLQALDTLGAGFTLASQDLDLRGAGNLLGEEQSGHIREVGLELYQEMLEEAVAAAGGASAEAEPAERWSPQINLGTTVLIPESYVPDLSLRLELYRRLAHLETPDSIEAFAAELIDRFGALPVEVDQLLKVIAIKLLCLRADLERVEAGPRGATLGFRDNRFRNPSGLVAFISREGKAAKLRPDHKLVVFREWPQPKDRLAGVSALLGQLVRIAEAALPEAVASAR